MKKLMLLATAVAGLTFAGMSGTAKADHCSPGYRGGSSYGSRGFYRPRSHSYSRFGIGRSYRRSHYGHRHSYHRHGYSRYGYGRSGIYIRGRNFSFGFRR